MPKRKLIDELSISNFKFFPEIKDGFKPVKIGGKHLLLFGENGAGKSSIFWSLYTLLECANKTDKKEIVKYFDYSDNQNLLNINAPPTANNRKVENAFVSIKFLNDPNDKYFISFDNQTINENVEAQESNYASDFINYRFVYSAFNFRHRDKIDLFENFQYNVFPYIKFEATKIRKINPQTGRWHDVVTENANEIIDFLEFGPEYRADGDKRTYETTKSFKTNFDNLIKKVILELKKWETHINTRGNEILQKELGYPNIEFALKVELKTNFHITKRRYTSPEICIWLTVPKYEGKDEKVHRLHSFLNEAKLTAISLAIRFAILEKRPSDAEVKILVLDDMMISLDMNNREKVLKFVFEKYLNQYQVLILTHDRVFFDFVKLIIKQKSNIDEWKIDEMYVGKNGSLPHEFPLIIASEDGHIEKAVKYYQAKDYTACALYLRKEIESLVMERLPEEYSVTSDSQFKTLNFLWGKCVERYQNLGKPVSEELKNYFVQTRLMILNPQAHHNLSQPVYKSELESAFDFVKQLRATCPIPMSNILLSKGMRLQFKHPSENYTIEFELNSNFSLDGLDGNAALSIPKCKIISWQYKGVALWDFEKGKAIELKKTIEDGLKAIKDRLVENTHVPLGITNDMFDSNTTVTNGIWSLKEVLEKAKITL
ncbi:MAG: hypothetical protein Q8T03_12135 [Bacteroidota bacterium]|nr:hypothetical protein [Bacteroidota bacterium]